MVPRQEPPPRQPSLSREPSATKPTFISPTPSVDGDDEESSIERTSTEMERPPPGHRGVPQYPGEDTRLTSRKELAGWYSYGWAAEVFAICAMGSFMPIALEQLARDQGVQLSDKKTPCRPSWQTTVDFNPNVSTPWLSMALKPESEPNPPCIIVLLGLEINTASFAMYTFSLSVLVQALIIISMSGAADHGKYRKTFLLAFAYVGAIAMMLFLAVVPRVYLLGALLAIIANTCFGASFVLLNSFLPLLVRYHPSIQFIGEETSSEASLENDETIEADDHARNGNEEGPLHPRVDSNTPLIPADGAADTSLHAPVPLANSPELKLSTRISSYGIGIGYIAGLLLQCLAIIIVIATGSTTFSLRLVLFVIGAWWFLFSIPAALWLRPRPGPPLSAGEAGKRRGWLGYVGYAWVALGKTALRARRLKDMLLFLGAWFLLSDGVATVSGTAVLFAKTQLGMKPAALGLINVIATLSGVFGAFSWSYFSRLLNLRASQTIVACICLFELIPLYGLLGFIPAVQDLGFLGLQQPWEMYPLGAVYGFVLGGLSSYCRSFFGELIPPGSEASFYALYAITDKGSSIFGPAIVGAITDRYGQIRPAFIFLAVLIGLPLPLMMLVDVDRGKREATEMAMALGGKQVKDSQYGTVPTIQFSDDEEDRTS